MEDNLRVANENDKEGKEKFTRLVMKKKAIVKLKILTCPKKQKKMKRGIKKYPPCHDNENIIER